MVAEHADLWNIPRGGDVDDLLGLGRLLDRYCAEIGRDPASITRSIHLPVDHDDPGATRDRVREAVDAGFTHEILGLGTPYPDGVDRWVADEIVVPARAWTAALKHGAGRRRMAP